MLEFVIGLPVGAFIGWIIREIVSDKLARDRDIDIMRRQEFTGAATTFRTTFTSELRELKTLIEYDKELIEENILKLLESSAVKFENACINFRSHIDTSERLSFDTAWKKYCHPQDGKPKDMPGPFYEYFIDMDIHNSVLLIIKNIENLLEFSKPI